MKNLTDKNKRTIWFDGEPGPLTPKGMISYIIRGTPFNFNLTIISR